MNENCKHIWRTNTQHKFKGWKCKKCGLEEHNVELVLRAKLTHYEAVVEAARGVVDFRPTLSKEIPKTVGDLMNLSIDLVTLTQAVTRLQQTLAAVEAQDG